MIRFLLPKLKSRKKFLSLFSLVFVLLSCGKDQKDPGAPYKAQVLYMEETPNANDAVSFKVGTKQFAYLNNLENLDSKYFQMSFGGKLTIGDIEGSQISDSTYTSGTPAPLRYSMDKGVLIPKDNSTLVMLSSFYQFEQVYGKLESLFGVPPDDYLSQFGKLSLIFEPSIYLKESGSTAEVTFKLNAAFSPAKRAFILFRRSAVENVPIATNLQVVAHEFGHSVFEYSFFNDKFDTCSRFRREYVIRGLNEGFADLVSWSVTGSANVLGASLDFSGLSEARQFSKLKFGFVDLLVPESIPFDDRCRGGIYCIGSLFAAGVYKAHQSLSRDNTSASRAQTMKDVFQALQKTQATMNQQSTEILPAALPSIADCEANAPKKLTGVYDTRVLSAFLRSFVLNAAQELKAPLCSGFADYFGSEGFNIPAREGVCQ